VKFESLFPLRLFNIQRYAECGINFSYFGFRKSTDEIGQKGFINTIYFITIYGTVVFKPFIYADLNLSGKTVVFGVNRSADYRGEIIINDLLPGNNQNNPIILWVILQPPIDPIEFASLHKPASCLRCFKASRLASLMNSSISSDCCLNLSALALIYSLSSSAVSFRLGAGVKAITVGPVGTSLGTSIVNRRFSGISTVCVMVIIKHNMKSSVSQIRGAISLPQKPHIISAILLVILILFAKWIFFN